MCPAARCRWGQLRKQEPLAGRWGPDPEPAAQAWKVTDHPIASFQRLATARLGRGHPSGCASDFVGKLPGQRTGDLLLVAFELIEPPFKAVDPGIFLSETDLPLIIREHKPTPQKRPRRPVSRGRPYRSWISHESNRTWRWGVEHGGDVKPRARSRPDPFPDQPISLFAHPVSNRPLVL